MKNIYVVLQDYYEEIEIHATFSTREKAEEFIGDAPHEYKFYIREYPLDNYDKVKVRQGYWIRFDSNTHNIECFGEEYHISKEDDIVLLSKSKSSIVIFVQTNDREEAIKKAEQFLSENKEQYQSENRKINQ